MPELPEVEQARSLLAEVAEGQRIEDVQTFEDNIVYSGIEHADFGSAIKGQTVDRVLRLGKQAYFTTQGGPSALFHLGMSGHTFVRGASEQLYYRKLKPQDLAENGQPLWPPRYVKLILRFASGAEWAFTDARRLGRLRLIKAGVDPLTEPPLSLLGRDGYNDLPSLEELSAVLAKRTAPIKALLLDQNGPIAGIGNYLIDEICFQSRIHPAQRSNTLDEEQLAQLHAQIKGVIGTAVSAKADYRQFPRDWLFTQRWGKGKGGKAPSVTLPDGSVGNVTFYTVGGRTSAVVEAVQKLPEGAAAAGPSKPGKAKGSPYKGKNRLKAPVSDLDSDDDVAEAVDEEKPTGVAQVVAESGATPARTPSRKAKRAVVSSSNGKSPYFEHDGESSELSGLDDDLKPSPAKRPRKSKKAKVDSDDEPATSSVAKKAGGRKARAVKT